MIIYWSPNWRINSDAYQWIVEKRSGTRKLKDGTTEPNWKAKEFHDDICYAIKCMVRRDIRALPVDVPADPACELILQVENRVDLWTREFQRMVGERDFSPERLRQYLEGEKTTPHRPELPCAGEKESQVDG